MKLRSRLILTILAGVSLFVLNFSSCASGKNSQTKSEPAVLTQTIAKAPIDTFIAVREEVKQSYIDLKDSTAEVTINLVGDLMCHMPQANNCKTSSGYDFNPSFEHVKKYLADADITIGNLELTCAGAGKPYSGYPNFNAPDEYITALKENGFDFLVTSNNHSMDTGEDGLLRTIEQVKKNNMGYTGTFNSQRDHDSVRIIDIKGIKVAVLNYTYGTNGALPAADHKYMLNVIDSAAITNEVKKAKELNPDFVLVIYHYGSEYIAEPIESQKNAVRWARDAGATLLIGGHPHVVGPCRWLAPDVHHKDSAFVAWSLGNFYSNQNKRYTDAGVILTLKLKKNFTQKKAFITGAEFVPTWVYRGEKADKKLHVIFPAEYAYIRQQLPAYLDSTLVGKMRQAAEDTKEMINKYGPAASLKPLKP